MKARRNREVFYLKKHLGISWKAGQNENFEGSIQNMIQGTKQRLIYQIILWVWKFSGKWSKTDQRDNLMK